jgi:protein-L-isoaspartate(D-aspartate) O-methyltransferase
MMHVPGPVTLVESIEQQLGRRLAPQVRQAFLTVPRHLFVEQYYRQRGADLQWECVQATPEQIYQDEALVTHIDARGLPTSSTSQPSVMAVQLEALALSSEQRVLEIGSGTGYNAALLAALVGESGQVISLDIDEALVVRAKHHLERAEASQVVVLTSNGTEGAIAYAPYDRLLATCSFRSLPRAWCEQLKLGGRLVGNWHTPLASLFVCLEKTGPGELKGSLLGLRASYMEMRPVTGLPKRAKIDWTQYEAQPSLRLPFPGIKSMLQQPAFGLLLQCLLPEVGKRYRSQGDEVQLYLLVRETAILVQDDEICIFGDEGVGAVLHQCVDLYQRLGQPTTTAYRVTFRERETIIHIGEHYFRLPVAMKE